MKFLSVPRLQKISSTLNCVDVGDQYIHARIEAYSCKAAGTDKRLGKQLERQLTDELAAVTSNTTTVISPSLSPTMSPLGPMSDVNTRKLLISLIQTMNASFPDYDFSNLRADQFERELSPAIAMSNINNLFLSTVLESLYPGIRTEFWEAINETADLDQCELYSYQPDLDISDIDAGKLWSVHYFFYHRKEKKVIFVTANAVSKLHPEEHDDDDDDGDRIIDDTLMNEGEQQGDGNIRGSDHETTETSGYYDEDEDEDEVDMLLSSSGADDYDDELRGDDAEMSNNNILFDELLFEQEAVTEQREQREQQQQQEQQQMRSPLWLPQTQPIFTTAAPYRQPSTTVIRDSRHKKGRDSIGSKKVARRNIKRDKSSPLISSIAPDKKATNNKKSNRRGRHKASSLAPSLAVAATSSSATPLALNDSSRSSSESISSPISSNNSSKKDVLTENTAAILPPTAVSETKNVDISSSSSGRPVVNFSNGRSLLDTKRSPSPVASTLPLATFPINQRNTTPSPSLSPGLTPTTASAPTPTPAATSKE